MNTASNNTNYQDFFNAISKPITRASVVQQSMHDILREATIERAIKDLTYCILSGIYGDEESWRGYERNGCKKLDKKIVLSEVIMNQYLYSRDPFSHRMPIHYKDAIPEVIERLKRIFTDFGFRQDELGTYWIVDWS